MSELPTIAHYVSSRNVITIDEAVDKGYPLLASCGFVWVPRLKDVADHPDLPLCERCERLSRSRNRTARGSDPHFVYRLYDEIDRLLYVGCTVDPRTRALAHKANTWWFDQVVRTRLTIFPDRDYALEKEGQAIADEHPRFNIRGRWPHRSLWEPEHYADYFLALSMAPEGGRRAADHRSKVALEAKRRYGLELEVEAAS